VDAGPAREICLGSSILLDAQAGGDSTATYSYQWSPATGLDNPTAEDPNASPASTTTYVVVATSNWGCESDPDQVLVSLLPTPVANAGADTMVCHGSTLQLNGSFGYTSTQPAPVSQVYFSWTPGATLNDTTLLQPTANPTQATWYYLTVSHNLCSTTDSVLISIVPDLGLTASADTNLSCQGDSVALFAQLGFGGASLTWFPGEGLSATAGANVMAAPDSTMTYWVIGNLGGCIDSASVTLAILPTPEMTFSHSSAIGCAPLTMSFLDESEGADFRTWDFGDGSPVSNSLHPSHTYTEAGTYTVHLTGVAEGGCTHTADDFTITVLEPVQAEFSSDPEAPAQLPLPGGLVQFFNQSTNAVSYVWDFGDGNAASTVNASHAFLGPGTYYVTLHATNEIGCTDSYMQGPYVILAPELFIPNVFSPNGDGVNDAFSVEYTGDQPFNLQVFDRWGVQMYGSTNKSIGWDGTNIKLSPVPDGTYYYKLRVGDRDFAGMISLVR